ncbi:MAG: hypothetical protein PHH14_05530 [Candidatus Margulisbacteria bacterium]|nr:hypothetical protein [Candidatus Margulisiibacteriota bacterium]
MKKLSCPICEAEIELFDNVKDKQRMTCPNCFAQLGLFKHAGSYVLACAICKEPIFDPSNCADCERRHEKKKKIIEEGQL